LAGERSSIRTIDRHCTWLGSDVDRSAHKHTGSVVHSTSTATQGLLVSFCIVHKESLQCLRVVLRSLPRLKAVICLGKSNERAQTKAKAVYTLLPGRGACSATHSQKGWVLIMHHESSLSRILEVSFFFLNHTMPGELSASLCYS